MSKTEDSLDTAQTLARSGEHTVPAADVPTGLDRYEMLGLIGEGGMGRVLEAVDKQFSRVVAIKELRAKGGDHERFFTEAIVTGNLEHPGVPPVYERGLRADGSPYYVMRRVRGRALEDALKDEADLEGRMSLLPALIRAAHTLGFAHEKGVVHRDIKPQNILVGTHGEVFVVDWGLARVGSLSSSATSSSQSQGGTGSRPQDTLAGAVMGTPAYMPPEQARGDVALVDARTDVFALGAVLYRLLSGKAPYEGGTLTEALERARKAEFTSIDTAAKLAPAVLRDICKKAMAARPEERFATAQHLADALEHFVHGAVHTTVDRGARRAAAIASGVVVLAFVVGVISFFRFDPRTVLGPSLVLGTIFLALSVSLAVFESRSRGRLGLGPLGFALTAAIFLTGVIGACYRVLAPSPLLIESVEKAMAGAILTGSLLTTLSLLAWGLVLRRQNR